MVLKGGQQRTEVCSRVTDRNAAIATVANVLLHISCDGLDIGSGVTGRNIVDELVSGEEQERIIVFLEFIDSGKDVLEVDVIVGGGGFISTDRVFGCVDVKSEVDASIGKLFHAFGVVLAVVDGVHSDGVDVELLEPRGLNELGFACSE